MKYTWKMIIMFCFIIYAFCPIIANDYIDDNSNWQSLGSITQKFQVKDETLDISIRDLMGYDYITFNPEVTIYYFNIPYEVEIIVISVDKKSSDYAITGEGTKVLAVGRNEFYVVSIAPDDTRFTYTFIVVREAVVTSDFKIISAQVNTITKDGVIKPLEGFHFDERLYTYDGFVVDNNVKNLLINFISSNATIEYYGNTDLKIGNNSIVVIVTSIDGKTIGRYIINVERKKMEYEVATNTPNGNEILPILNKNNSYCIALSKSEVTELDYKELITVSGENTLTTVRLLTDVSKETREVLLEVTDGEETHIIRFIIEVPFSFLNYFEEIDIADVVIAVIGFSLIALLIISLRKDKIYNIVKGKRRERL